LPSVQHLPAGRGFLNTGDAEIFVELFLGFAMAMVAGLACIYMVLLLLFNHPMPAADHPDGGAAVRRAAPSGRCC
jgi:multidrug efflux pump subunit AcrB